MRIQAVKLLVSTFLRGIWDHGSSSGCIKQDLTP